MILLSIERMYQSFIWAFQPETMERETPSPSPIPDAVEGGPRWVDIRERGVTSRVCRVHGAGKHGTSPQRGCHGRAVGLIRRSRAELPGTCHSLSCLQQIEPEESRSLADPLAADCRGHPTGGLRQSPFYASRQLQLIVLR